MSFSIHALDSGIRGQVVRSDHFTAFKRDKMNLYRTQGNQQGKNGHETCIINEWNQIAADPKPPFYPYFGVRMPEYRAVGSRYAINELEACIEHDYFNNSCEAHHDSSLICNGTVFAPTPIGEAAGSVTNINSDDAIKNAVDAAVESAVFGAGAHTE